ncbi:nucleotidyltransferase family protein [Desulfobotulus mexicanus]|uniref:Nucleotidyltransferase n=1 Tax=Desulfobotulus mexicanus TaxID=2586642 RepID=A0A5Q4VDQ2_9BACT|nr:nucleotidyltransferase domain-containing protein [Desulfobotulus mexicanus]TYT75824.1 nucleotidyltransferase [Desulfobotulus mexicanus]
MTKDQIIIKIKENYPYLMSEFGLKKIGLFGSYAKGVQEESSDIDIVAEFEKPIGLKFVIFAEYLENILGKKADILTPAGIKGIRNPDIAKSIMETIEYV